MLLNKEQLDGVKELLNIGFGKTAAALSNLTGRRIIMEAPQLTVACMKEIPAMFEDRLEGEVTTIHQIFWGSIAGDAVMVMDYDEAVTLCNMLSEERVAGPLIDSADVEVLAEVGNILISNCLGSISNMLKASLRLSVPRLRIDSLGKMLMTLVIDDEEIRYGLIGTARFRIEKSEMGGWLIIIIGVSSLDRLMEALNREFGS